MNAKFDGLPGGLRRAVWALGLAFVILGLLTGPARAEPPRPPILDKVGLDQKLDAQVPLDLVFRDEIWRSVSLRDYLTDGKPVILTLNYYNCKNTCSVVLDDLVQKLGTISFNIGEQYNIVSVSINPRETPQDAARTKSAFEHRYPRPGVDTYWHFLTGDQAAIEELADSVGFRYAYDETAGEYVHPDVVLLLTPDGRVSKYLFAPNYSGQDLRLGLIDSSQGQIGTLVDKVLLFCYQYDPTIGKYSLAILNTVRIGSLIAFVLLAGFMIVMFRRDARKPSPGV
ncbi:MAG: SCO family protein [Anaerolineae bacterium]|nr:SCO family protein [Anaerolineae bacterium]